jgi:hypothetical protein
MRRIAAVSALALFVSACSSTTSGSTTAGTAAETSTTAVAAPSSSTTVGTGTTVPGVTPTTVRQRPDGDAAPDFTLALGEGGEFTLSDEQKPVYMVFWAEW